MIASGGVVRLQAEGTTVIVETVFERARVTPDKPAVISNGEAISYGRFARLILARRREFAAQRLRPGAVAVLCLGRILDSWVASLALRSLGLTTLSARRLDEIPLLGPLDIDCVVTNAEQGPAPEGFRVLLVPRGWPGEVPDGPLETPSLAGPEGGHILLTSGTTGGGKMFAMSPVADAVNFASHIEIAGLTERTVMALFNFGLWTSAGYNVAASVWCAGGTVVIDQAEHAGDCLFVREITDAWMTPFLLSQQLASPDRVRRLDQVRLIVGGAAVSQVLADEVFARVTRRLSILVAATETGPWCLDPVETPDDLVWRAPHPSRQVQIVDDADRPLPPGQVGRIRVRTIDGASGYLGAEEASRAFFRDGWFYPGDLGLGREDGRIALQGRATDVIHMYGAKVAAGPIEQALRDRLGVEEVCVFSAPNARMEEELHVVLQTRRPITAEALTAAAQAVLHGYPHAFFHKLDSLPRNGMGKVQRAELKARFMDGA